MKRNAPEKYTRKATSHWSVNLSHLLCDPQLYGVCSIPIQIYEKVCLAQSFNPFDPTIHSFHLFFFSMANSEPPQQMDLPWQCHVKAFPLVVLPGKAGQIAGPDALAHDWPHHLL